MKKLILFLIFLIFFASIVVGTFLFLRSRQNINFTLIVEEGSVYYRLPGSTEYVRVDSEEIELRSETFVKTGADGLSQVIMPDNSIMSIDVNTEVQIALSGNDVNIDQLIGNTWHRVETVTKGGNYKVSTPNAVAAVRGTIFGINVLTEGEELISNVLVEESKVSLSVFTDSSRNQLKDETVVEQGQWGEVRFNEALQSFEWKKDLIPEYIKDTKWYLRNKELDSFIKDLDNTNLRDGLRNIVKKKILNNSEQVLVG